MPSDNPIRSRAAAPTLPERELQALREVGRTEITSRVAALLAGLFLVTLVVVPLARPFSGAEEPPLAPFAELGARLAAAPEEGGLFAANRAAIAALRAFEDRLEAGSWPRRRLLPPLQHLLTGWLGAGNEQAYPGRDGWLYYRPDVDHLSGPAFLDPEVLERKRRGGEAWEEPPQPDPVAALAAFAGQLAERGARLVVLPTPVKPAIRPEPLAPRAEPPLANPSFALFRERLEAAGVLVVDPAPALAALPGERYLRTDTHWRPEAVERVAALLAEAVSPLLGPSAGAPVLRRRPVVVENRGDIAVMLRLPPAQTLYPPERVEPSSVLDNRNRPWRPDPEAELLLLGDSFTNVYSDPGLGWGRAAGLAEQLAFELGRPLDKLALNAGGAHATRQALARAVTNGRIRLDNKSVVVYQFATRELSFGDWREVELP